VSPGCAGTRAAGPGIDTASSKRQERRYDDDAAFPSGTYQLIYADPPWNYKTYSAKGQGKSPSQHYGVMDTAAICQLPVQQLATPDSILAMWVYTPKLPDAFTMMASCGFTYETLSWWDKVTAFSTGHYFRTGGELLILGKRGKGLSPRYDRSVRQIIREKKRKHSQKPDGMYVALERMFGPDVSRFELFARQTRDGWTSWGNQVAEQEPPAQRLLL
jgi:N6-adenosine-specific RNA methylase IME4